MVIRLFSSFFAAALVFFPAAALAFELAPISRQFESSGSGATQSYELVNKSREFVAIELRTVQREIDPRGGETLTEAEDDFLIFPAQVILNPGARQTVRVSYIGDPSPANEMAYRLVAEQLPIDGLGTPLKAPEGDRSGQVRVLMKYQGSLYVRPPNARAKVRVLAAIGKRKQSSGSELQLELSNVGTARAEFGELEVRVKSQDKSSSWISLRSIKTAAIMAGAARQVTLPWPAGLPWSEQPTVEVRSRR